MKLSLRRIALPFVAAAVLTTGLFMKEKTAAAQVIQIAPPPPRVEVMGIAPSPRHVWFPGYWGWREGYGVAWTAGRWGMGRPGHSWVAPHWVGERGHYRFAPGGWHRR